LERREARARTNLSVPINSGREENRRYRTASGSDRPLIKVSVDNKRPVATARGSVTTCLPTFNWRTGLISPQRSQRFFAEDAEESNLSVALREPLRSSAVQNPVRRVQSCLSFARCAITRL